MLLAVYGTLRQGDYNYDRFLNGYEPLRTEEIDGFQMWQSNGSYPYVIKGDGSIVVELYDVPASLVLEIGSMEIGAGYEAVEIGIVAMGEAIMFVYPELGHADNVAWAKKHKQKPPRRILSGNWFEWLKKYQPERIEYAGN